MVRFISPYRVCGGTEARRYNTYVAPFLHRLIDMGIADPNRLGLMGHSYGGYCVLALLTQTDFFSAAICSAGTVNLTSAYGDLTDDGDSSWGYFEVGQGRMDGTLWERRSSYIISPLSTWWRGGQGVRRGTEDRGATSQRSVQRFAPSRTESGTAIVSWRRTLAGQLDRRQLERFM